MTHPTIEAMANAIKLTPRGDNCTEDAITPNATELAKAAIRALLTAEPSGAEVLGAMRIFRAEIVDQSDNYFHWLAYTCLKAARAAQMKEMGL